VPPRADAPGLIDLDALRDLVREVVRDELAGLKKPDAHALTVAEAAELARVTPGCVRRWIRTRRLRANGAGKLLRVERADLDALLRGAGAGIDDDRAADEIAARVLRRRAG
jgi:excisionase family DNA binding protein